MTTSPSRRIRVLVFAVLTATLAALAVGNPPGASADTILGPGFMTIRNNPAYCLDADRQDGPVPTANQKLQTYLCSSDSNNAAQKFEYNLTTNEIRIDGDTTDAYFFCLQYSNTTKRVVLGYCNGSINQKWYRSASTAGDPFYILRHAGPNNSMCMDALTSSPNGVGNRTPVGLFKCNSNDSHQQWGMP